MSTGKFKRVPKLMSLHPRTKLLIELNVMGTHFQCAILFKAMEPSVFEPTEYGLTKEEDMLLPTTLPNGVEPLPQNIVCNSACQLHLQERQYCLFDVAQVLTASIL